MSLGTNPDNDTYVANTSPKHEHIVKPLEKTQNSTVPYLRWMLGPLKPGSSGHPPGLVGAYPSHSAVLERSFPEFVHAAATQTIKLHFSIHKAKLKVVRCVQHEPLSFTVTDRLRAAITWTRLLPLKIKFGQNP